MIQYLQLLLGARFAKSDDRGASAVEYGLLIAGIAAVVIAGIVLLGGNLLDLFNNTAGDVANP